MASPLEMLSLAEDSTDAPESSAPGTQAPYRAGYEPSPLAAITSGDSDLILRGINQLTQMSAGLQKDPIADQFRELAQAWTPRVEDLKAARTANTQAQAGVGEAYDQAQKNLDSLSRWKAFVYGASRPARNALESFGNAYGTQAAFDKNMVDSKNELTLGKAASAAKFGQQNVADVEKQALTASSMMGRVAALDKINALIQKPGATSMEEKIVDGMYWAGYSKTPPGQVQVRRIFAQKHLPVNSPMAAFLNQDPTADPSAPDFAQKVAAFVSESGASTDLLQDSAGNKYRVNSKTGQVQKADGAGWTTIPANEMPKDVVKVGVKGTEVGGSVIPPEHANLKGEDYLNTLPAGLRNSVRGVAEGRIPLTSFSTKGGQREAIIERVSQFDPTFEAGKAPARAALWKDFTAGVAAKNVTAINTAIGHLSTLDELGQALQNKDLQLANRVINRIKAETGKPDISNYEMAQGAVANELMRVFRQVGASEAETKDWERKLSAKMSPQQLRETIKTAAELLQSRVDALNDQWKRGMNSDQGYPQLLSPKSAAFMARLSGGGAAPTARNSKLEEALKLYGPTR